MSRVTLRERFFPLHQPDDVDRFLERFAWSAHALFHLDEFAIVPDHLVPMLREHLSVEVGPPVRSEEVVTIEPYRVLLSRLLQGTLPEERFQWGYLDRLAKEALWRDDETFARGRVSGSARRPARAAEGARRADARPPRGTVRTL